ncbi:MAG: energy-coupling factor transporter transmembrane component T family protein [Spirochaetota bacterium]
MKRERDEFHIMAGLGIGQYVAGDSFLHRLDPRFKLVLGAALAATALIVQSLSALALLFTAVTLTLVATGMPARLSFAALKPVAVFLLLVAAIQVLAVPQLREGSRVLWAWRFLVVTDRSLRAGVLLLGRFVVVVLGASLFSFTTSTTQLVHGAEHLLRPLQRVGFPAHELALVMHICLRFVPILAGELERLMKAQASRGADFGGGGRFSLVRRYRRLIPLFVPLVNQGLEHAYTLVEAMEARCYLGGKGRSSLIRLRARAADAVVLAGGISLCFAALLLGRLETDAKLLDLARSVLLAGG